MLFDYGTYGGESFESPLGINAPLTRPLTKEAVEGKHLSGVTPHLLRLIEEYPLIGSVDVRLYSGYVRREIQSMIENFVSKPITLEKTLL